MSSITWKRSDGDQEFVTEFEGAIRFGFLEIINQEGTLDHIHVVKANYSDGRPYSRSGIQVGIRTANRIKAELLNPQRTLSSVHIITVRYTLHKQLLMQVLHTNSLSRAIEALRILQPDLRYTDLVEILETPVTGSTQLVSNDLVKVYFETSPYAAILITIELTGKAPMTILYRDSSLLLSLRSIRESMQIPRSAIRRIWYRRHDSNMLQNFTPAVEAEALETVFST